MVKKVAGYGVFNSIGGYIFFLSTGQGYGVVVDNSTGEKIYMKVMQVGAGLGLGVKDFRLVFIFRNQQVLNDFINKGWEFGEQADAAVKSGEKGGAVGGEVYLESDIIIYQLTEAGVALRATVAGTKYWKDEDLN
jgi:lipid-binding SYLF domain-containing protein